LETIFVTGASGAIGPHLLAALLRESTAARCCVLLRPGPVTIDERVARLRRRVTELSDFDEAAACEIHERLLPVAGDVRQPQCGIAPTIAARLTSDTTCLIHAAADTRFYAEAVEQWTTNVEGTRHVLDLARSCQKLRRLVLVSTTCVAGVRTGTVVEDLIADAPDFVNHYERTKWEAEHLAAASGLPLTIVRLATCAGSQMSGAVERLGGLHWALKWMQRGLVPMVPGRPDCPVDLISTELAAGLIAHVAALRSRPDLEICHASSGIAAPKFLELLVTLGELFSARDAAWRRNQITPPPIVTAETFSAFRRTVETSGDLLFRSVIASVDAFLPALLYPKTFATSTAERLWGGELPLPDWRELVQKVVDHCLATNRGRNERGVGLHA